MITNTRANEYAANLCKANEDQIGLKISNLDKEIEALKLRIENSRPSVIAAKNRAWAEAMAQPQDWSLLRKVLFMALTDIAKK